MGLTIIQGDITTLEVDAIVSAANHHLQPGGGVCGAIHRAAGPQLEAACRELGGCPVGSARITPGFKLPARFVIHAVGPFWHHGEQGEEGFLASAYREALALCDRHGIKTIAFPLISTGTYGYPMAKACEVAVKEIRAWTEHHTLPETVTVVAYDSDALDALEQAKESSDA